MAIFSHKDAVIGTNATLAKFLYNPSSMDDMVVVATIGSSSVIARVILDMVTDDDWMVVGHKATILWFDMGTNHACEEQVKLAYQKNGYPMSQSLEQLMLQRGYADVQICHF